MKNPLFFASLMALLALSPYDAAYSQIVSLGFDDPANGTMTTNSGTAGGSAIFQNSTFIATDFHGAPGSGVSGLSDDRAFNNSGSTGMGSAGTGGRVILAGAALSSLSSFTVTGWFNASSNINNAARIIEIYDSASNNFRISADAPNRLAFTLATPTSPTAVSVYSDGSSSAYAGVDTWTFFALTYDGTQTSSNVKFYVGGIDAAVSQVGWNLTVNGGALGAFTTDLMIGGGPSRPFDGFLDDLQIYGASGSASGALTPIQLEAIRMASIPEPSTVFLLSIAFGGGVFIRRRRQRVATGIADYRSSL